MADQQARDDLEASLSPPQAGDVVDEILLAGDSDQPQRNAAGPSQPHRREGRIPIVDTVESALDLPPNWATGNLPPLAGGVAGSLPPPPPSLGSERGRGSQRSGSSRRSAQRSISERHRPGRPGDHQERARSHHSSASRASRTISERKKPG